MAPQILVLGGRVWLWYWRREGCGKLAAPTDPVHLAAHNKKNVKAKRIIMDGFRPHYSSSVW
jgi:hypothetical protein